MVTKSIDTETGEITSAGGTTSLTAALERSEDPHPDRQDLKAELPRLLLDLTKAGLSTPDLKQFLAKAYELIGSVVKAGECVIFLRDRLSGQLTAEYDSRAEQDAEATASLQRIASQLLRTREPIIASAVQDEEKFSAADIDPNWLSFIGLPLKTAIRSIGTINLASSKNKFTVGADELEFLSLAAEQIAVTVERRRAEDALRESEGRYRMLFDHAPDGIVITDPQGKLLDANAGLCETLGYTITEFLHLSAAEIVDPSEIEEISRALEEIAVRAEHHREWTFLRKDGTTFVADVSAARMPDGNILAIIRDLSESRKAELEKAVLAAEVELQRERIKNLVGHVPGIVWETSVDPSTNSQIGNFVSDYLTEMLGYSVREWLGKVDFWQSIVHPDCKRKSEAASAFSADGRGVQEIALIAKNGRVVWVEAHVAAIVDSDGRIAGTRGVMIDIMERKRSERALRTSEERYRDLVENAIDIIYVHDLQGNYTSINKAAERITGYTRDEILGMNMARSIAPEYLDKAREMISAKLEGKEVTAYEVEVIAKDGRRIALEVNTRLIYDNGIPVAIQGIARDTTERRLLEEKYRQSQKLEAVGLLAGGISHDFNNLLTAISGYSEITLSRMSEDDPLRHNIEEIKEIGERASALTHQLLAFSRKQVLKPVVHNLNSVIQNMDSMLRRLVRENIAFDIDLSADVGNVEADPGQIEQVIVNLAINAQDAMPNGGTLSISTQRVEFGAFDDSESVKLGIGPFVKMTVADTGDGMDEQVQERIFEPFFTTKASGKGSGLGLSTVHGIVKQSGGEILVHSTRGLGTTFEIYLPSVAETKDKEEWSPGPTQIYSGSETILLVEDDRSVRRLVREILADSGYEVLEASSGEAALEICETTDKTIHMLLTDLVMPQMSGIELTTRVRSLHPETKPLVMTGYATDSPIRGSMKNFDATFIEKPFTPEGLARKIREVLEA